MLHAPLIRAVAASALAIASAGCGGGTQLAVKYASNYSPPKGSFSVFGVFENGRLSPEAWLELGPTLSSGFSQSLCETAWHTGFLSAKPDLAAAIDDYTKDDGVTDKLLDHLAPMAKGASILSVSVLGHRPGPETDEPPKPSGSGSSRPTPVGGRAGGLARGGMHGTGWPQPRLPDVPDSESKDSAYEMSALLYSVQEHRAIVLVSMTHSGPNLDAALRQFSEKLRAAIPNVTCSGWNFEANVDAAAVRALIHRETPEPTGE